MSEALPQRVVVIGASGAGKTRLAERLARAIDAPFVEMDALYWLPEWVARAPEEFVGRLAQATAGERWVAAGNYFSSGAGQTVWARADCLVWIDLPLRTTLPRLLVRSWRRWRHHELLWGRNVERFWRSSGCGTRRPRCGPTRSARTARDVGATSRCCAILGGRTCASCT